MKRKKMKPSRVLEIGNIFQRFIIDGERLKDFQNKFLEKVEQFYAQRRVN